MSRSSSDAEKVLAKAAAWELLGFLFLPITIVIELSAACIRGLAQLGRRIARRRS